MEYCSPSALDRKNKFCFSRNSLEKIINAWNTLMPNDKIIIHKKNRMNVNFIIQTIDDMFKKYIHRANTYWAWTEIIKQMAKKINNSSIIQEMTQIEKQDLRPSQPTEWVQNPVEWLSNFDIDKVMKQYESLDKYKYRFLGVFSIDFGIKQGDKCLYSNHCNINLKEILSSGKTKYFGFVTNLSKSTEPGTHWTSSFFVLDPSLKCFGGYYYDSTAYGIPNDLKPVFDDIKKQAEDIFHKPFPIHINTIRHQKSNTECGIFSICFQTRWLNCLYKNKENITFDEVVNYKGYTDDIMKKLRNRLFRPNIKSIKKKSA
jgi:hypothetical protein